MDIETMLARVDHTQLKPYCTWEDIQALCQEAVAYHTASVCIPPCYVRRVHDTYGDQLKICTVIGFPLGYQVTAAGADYIKTSTGFGIGGATREDVQLFKENIGPDVKIKAAGGVSTLEDLEDFIRLGCDRVGTSRAVGLVKGQ